MRRGECAFELREQPCVSCEKPTGQLGTCEDSIFCAECRQVLVMADCEREVADAFIRLAEEPVRISIVDDGDDE